MKNKFTVIGTFLILGLVIMACGGGGATETPEPSGDVPPSATETPASAGMPVPPDDTTPPDVQLEPGWTVYTNANYVRDITLHDGFLWAATGGGVIAWDLASDDVFWYNTLAGLPTNDIDAIVSCPIPEPSIIAGTEHGLSIYDPDTDTWGLMTPDNSGMERTGVDSLDCDADSNRLMVGYTFGLDIYDAVADEWEYLDEDDGLATDWVTQASVIGSDLWIVSSFGVSIVHADGSVTPFTEDTSDIPDENVSAVAGDADGNIWLAAFDGLLKYSDGAWTLYNSDNTEEFPFLDAFEGVVVAPDGTVWVGNTFGTVCQFDPVAESCLAIYEDEPGMLDGLVNLIIDEQGGIYYNDDDDEGGISMFDGTGWHTASLDELPISNSYNAITQIDNYVYLGGSFGLQILDLYDPSGEWTLNDMENYTVNVFYHTTDGVWVGHGGGASFYEYEGDRWTNVQRGEEAGEGIYDGGVTAVTVDGAGRVWFGTYNGLTVWDDGTFTYYDLLSEEEIAEEWSARSVYALEYDGTYVWVGAYGALFRFDENDEFVRWDSDLPGLLSIFTPSADAFALDQDGSLLLAIGRRLLRYSDESFGEVVEAAGEINSILVTDEGEILLGLDSSGVAYFDGSEWASLSTLEGDPLPSNHFGDQGILVDSLGTIWFAASEGGLVRYVP